jgi:predicted AlkP superfamily pyrophosphatase or phosphodiesterase
VGQVVLVVVDALRADFVFPENILAKIGVASAQYMDESKDSNVVMRPKITVLTDWIQNSNPNVNAFVARANAPTVTMPRIKVTYPLLKNLYYIIISTPKVNK